MGASSLHSPQTAHQVDDGKQADQRPWRNPEELKTYRAAKNRQSIDGLSALFPDATTGKSEP